MKQKVERQKGALERLRKQLSTGSKTAKKNEAYRIPLTDSDVKRIQKEITTLEDRLGIPNAKRTIPVVESDHVLEDMIADDAMDSEGIHEQ